MSVRLKCGIRIDAEAIACGLYALMPDEYRNALALGMLPGPLFDILTKLLNQKADEIFDAQCVKQYGFRPGADDLGSDSVAECIVAWISDAKIAFKTEFVKESVRVVSLAMYDVAPMVV